MALNEIDIIIITDVTHVMLSCNILLLVSVIAIIIIISLYIELGVCSLRNILLLIVVTMNGVFTLIITILPSCDLLSLLTYR